MLTKQSQIEIMDSKTAANDNANNINNILGLIVSILDWLKSAEKAEEKDLTCPDKCEVDNAVEKLKELTAKLGKLDQSKSCSCNVGGCTQDSEEIQCTGGEGGTKCKDPKCETCEKIRKLRQEADKVAAKVANSCTTAIVKTKDSEEIPCFGGEGGGPCNNPNCETCEKIRKLKQEGSKESAKYTCPASIKEIEKENEESDEIPCFGGEGGGKCKNPNCETCEKIRKLKKQVTAKEADKYSCPATIQEIEKKGEKSEKIPCSGGEGGGPCNNLNCETCDKIRKLKQEGSKEAAEYTCPASIKEVEKENEESDEIPCFGGESGGKCKNPNCETCEKIRKLKKQVTAKEAAKYSCPATIKEIEKINCGYDEGKTEKSEEIACFGGEGGGRCKDPKCETCEKIRKMNQEATKEASKKSSKDSCPSGLKVIEKRSCTVEERKSEASEEIPCYGGEDGGRCKNPTCETCETIREFYKFKLNEAAKDAAKKTSKDSCSVAIVKEIVETCSKPSLTNTQKIDDYECPLLKLLYTRCEKCCQTSKETITEKPRCDQIDDQLKLNKDKNDRCSCKPKEKPKPVVTSNTPVKPTCKVETYEKKVQAHQFQIMYEVRKAVLNSIYAAGRIDNNRNLNCGVPITKAGQTTYRKVELTYASEDDDGEDDDEDTFYDCIKPPSPIKSLVPCVQQPTPAYGSNIYYAPPCFNPLAYQPSRIPQRGSYNGRTESPYQSYRHYELRYPMVSEGVKNSASPPRTRIQMCGVPIKPCGSSTSREVTLSSVGTKSPTLRTGYTPPKDCARRLIEAIMKNPNSPAYEALKEAVMNDSQSEDESSSDTDSRRSISQSKRSSFGTCADDCTGTPKKKRSQT